MLTIQERMRTLLEQRREAGLLRTLPAPIAGAIDFYSNDYLGLARDLPHPLPYPAGATGSRLISGNSLLAEQVEHEIAIFHRAEAALLFPSGYAANIGLIPAVTGRKDTIIYDRLIHASLRDGIGLSQAKALGFAHNDLADLQKKLAKAEGNKWVVVESVYSMDGDQAPLAEIVAICEAQDAQLIVDEAHGTGVLGERGEGLVVAQGLEEQVWARIHTFGKAMGSHGAAVVGSRLLRDFLINFARSFIYTTGLPPASLINIREAYQRLQHSDIVERLRQRVAYFSAHCPATIKTRLIPSNTPVQAVLCPGNEAVQQLAKHLQTEKFAVLPIRYPTVPEGKERIRVCLHTFNTNEEVDQLLACLDIYFSP